MLSPLKACFPGRDEIRFYFQELQGNLGSEAEGCCVTCPLLTAGLPAQEKHPEASPMKRSLVQIPRSKHGKLLVKN